MIGSLRGKVVVKAATHIVMECGGVGYEVSVTPSVSERLPDAGGEVFLLTEFIVREDAQLLFGFLEGRERELFRSLLKVSGIGAKTALGMMALGVGELLEALGAEDVVRVSRAPGVGRKTAERLIVEFRGSPLLLESAGAGGGKTGENAEAEQALAALGYRKKEIADALSALPKEEMGVSEKVRAALRVLSGRS